MVLCMTELGLRVGRGEAGNRRHRLRGRCVAAPATQRARGGGSADDSAIMFRLEDLSSAWPSVLCVAGRVHSTLRPAGQADHSHRRLRCDLAPRKSGGIAKPCGRHARVAPKPCKPDAECRCDAQADRRFLGAQVHRHHQSVRQGRSRYPLSRGDALAGEKGGAP